MTEKIDPNGRIVLPAKLIPGFRSEVAIQNGVERNVIFKTWGGLGDQICAEPTIRHAIKMFKDCKISLASEQPQLFQHLKFERVFDLNDITPNYSKYLSFETITPPDDSNLVWQFFSHMLTNCVDFPSMCALRTQLPIAEKNIVLVPTAEQCNSVKVKCASQVGPMVCVHAGKHWESKTFPVDWWNEVIHRLRAENIMPVLIGADADDNRSTVDVDPTGCLDLRSKLSIMESVALLQAAPVLITNDSAPLHMAASGHAWIGFIATCKHPDFISHWRKPLGSSIVDFSQSHSGGNVWSWRMENLGLGGFWDLADYCPNKKQKVECDKVDENILRSWLPKPERVVEWILQKLNA